MRYMRTEYKRMAFIWLIMLFFFLLIIAGLFIIKPAHAGVVMNPSGKMHVINLDRVKHPVQIQSFDLKPLRDKIKNGQPFDKDLDSLIHARRLYVEMDRILDAVFIVDGDDKLKRTLEAGDLSETGGGFAFGEIEVGKMADRLYKQIVSSSSVADIDAINKTLYDIIDKAKMKQSFRAEAKELERIREVIHQAKIRAEEVLTKEELAKLLEAAKLTLAKAKEQVEEVIDAAHQRQTFGAMVFCGSEIIQ